jgi:hypothetical protein
VIVISDKQLGSLCDEGWLGDISKFFAKFISHMLTEARTTEVGTTQMDVVRSMW